MLWASHLSVAVAWVAPCSVMCDSEDCTPGSLDWPRGNRVAGKFFFLEKVMVWGKEISYSASTKNVLASKGSHCFEGCHTAFIKGTVNGGPCWVSLRFSTGLFSWPSYSRKSDISAEFIRNLEGNGILMGVLKQNNAASVRDFIWACVLQHSVHYRPLSCPQTALLTFFP